MTRPLAAVPGCFPNPAVISRWAGLLLFCCGIGSVVADDPSLTSTQIGFDGVTVLGRWVPVSATPPNSLSGPHQLRVRAVDPDGREVIYASDTATLPISEPVSVLVRIANPSEPVTVEWVPVDGDTDGETVATETIPLPSEPLRLSERVIGTIGKFDTTLLDGAEKTTRVDLDTMPRLPESPFALEAFDRIVVSELGAVTANQAKAIETWVVEGGHLIVIVQSETDLEQTPLASWLPVRIASRKTLREFASLEVFVSRSAPIARAEAPVSLLEPVNRREESSETEPDWTVGGTVLPRESEVPLILRIPHGFGLVTALGIRPDQPPLTEWRERAPFFARILASEDRSAITPEGGGDRLSRTGIADLGTQLSVAGEQFPGVRKFGFNAVLGLAILYLLVIGPLDYLLVHKLLKKPRLSWITVPVWIVGGILVVIGAARSGNGSEVRVDRLDVVDIDAVGGHLRGHSLMHLYSPDADRYAIGFSEANRSDPRSFGSLRVGWIASAEESFGGLYRPSLLRFGQTRYRSTPGADRLEGFALAPWSSAQFSASSLGRVTGPVIDSNLTSSGIGQIDGTITNRFDFPIEDWVLAYEDKVYFPKRIVGTDSDGSDFSLQPGDRWDFRSLQTTSRTLRSFLTGQQSVAVEGFGSLAEATSQQTLPYDPTSTDTSDLLRMMTFHNASGGTGYTGLSHDLLGHWELTPLLGLNRAVLIGRIPDSDQRLLVDGEPIAGTERVTYLRVLLPVRDIQIEDDQLFIDSKREDDLSE